MFELQRINERCVLRQGGLRKHCVIALQILVKLASASEWSVNQELHAMGAWPALTSSESEVLEQPHI